MYIQYFIFDYGYFLADLRYLCHFAFYFCYTLTQKYVVLYAIYVKHANCILAAMTIRLPNNC